jgi:aryl-alcohol dehydrogenase-like predicted oxidoreductase
VQPAVARDDDLTRGATRAATETLEMDKRPLGRTGLSIAPLVFGGNVFGWTANEARSFELLDAFVDAGFDAIDTADAYSTWVPGHRGGESETVIGAWLRRNPQRRAQVRILTKVGSDMGPPGHKGLSARWIAQAVEDSLRRIGTDHIDLYQSHFPDETPYEETLRAYERLILDGKVLAIGVSNVDAAQLAESLRVAGATGLPRYECLQPEYSLVERAKFEGDLATLVRREGLGVITYFSLASGFLAGKYRSAADLEGRARSRLVGKYLNPRGLRILAALDAVAGHRGCAPASVALAWLIARPGVTAPIASATSLPQLHDLMAGARLTLSVGDVEALDAASAP